MVVWYFLHWIACNNRQVPPLVVVAITQLGRKSPGESQG
uniref:Uncharacterized protein n=1 Tax=Anguilla anguilla TaxID=7936 RepID=A0A0E9PE56_ANGAN